MTKLAKQILVTITLVGFSSSLAIADEKKHENLNPKFEKFKFSEDHCPDEIVFPGSRKCLVTATQLKAKKTSLTLVQYRYLAPDSSEDQTFENQDFAQQNYLVRQSDKAVIWKHTEEIHIKSMKLISFDSSELIEIVFFTGGNAGYWREYFSLEDGQVYPVTESYIKKAKSLIPEGYHTIDWTTDHLGGGGESIWGRRVGISFPELETEAAVEKEGDEYFCPTGLLKLKLALNGRDFKLVSGKFEKTECEN